MIKKNYFVFAKRLRKTLETSFLHFRMMEVFFLKKGELEPVLVTKYFAFSKNFQT